MVAIFKNPDEPERKPWEAPKFPSFSYGFMLRGIPYEGILDEGMPGKGIGLLVLVSSDKTWRVELRGSYYEARHGDVYSDGGLWVKQYNQSWGRRRLHLLSSGSLEDAGIVFNVAALEKNHLMFMAEGDTYAMAVNGQDVPLGIDAEDVRKVEEHIGRYRYYDDGKWHGHRNITWK